MSSVSSCVRFRKKHRNSGTFYFLVVAGDKSGNYLRGQYNHVGDCVWLRSFHSGLLCLRGALLSKKIAKSPLGMPRNLGLRRTRYVDGNVGGFGRSWVFTLVVIVFSRLNMLLTSYAKTSLGHHDPASVLSFLTFVSFSLL